MRFVLLVVLMGCAGKEEDSAVEDECYTNEDCPDGLVCVIRHDHAGDDHDHGGDCEDPDSDTDAPGGENDTEPDTDCPACPESHKIILDYSGWQPGEYHFAVDVPDLGERYTCVSVLPGGVYMGENNCPANVIGTEIRITEEQMEPTALLIYRSDFASAAVSVSYLGEDTTEMQSLVESIEIIPEWSEDEVCECTTSVPSTVTF